MLKVKLGQFELKNRELTETIKELRDQCEELTEDLIHAKVVLEKRTQNSQEVDELQRELSQQTMEGRAVENRTVENRTLETKTVSRERRIEFNKENEGRGGDFSGGN